jgi:DNA-binding LytR/AlgR family response regulator
VGSSLKIAVVEDELIIATTMARKLISLGYEVLPPCSSFNEAIIQLAEEKPDLVLIDIRIKGTRDGVELAKHIRNNYDMPLVFVTANGDPATINRAKAATPNAYVIKPFTKQELHAAIEIAMLNYKPSIPERPAGYLVIKISHDLVRIQSDEIVFLESDGNYVNIIMRGSRVRRFRITLAVLEEQLDQLVFFRIGRSVIVNFKFVSELETTRVAVDGKYMSIGKPYRKRDEMLLAFSSFSEYRK